MHARFYFRGACSQKAIKSYLNAWSCLRFRLCHLSAFPNRSKAVLNGSNLLYLSFYSDDIYNYEVCISLLKADKIISQKDRLCFFMHDVIFGMVKSHVNNGVLWLQWYEAEVGYLSIKTITPCLVKRENVPILADYCVRFLCLFISFSIHGITPQNIHLLDSVFSCFRCNFETPLYDGPVVRDFSLSRVLRLLFYSGVTANVNGKQTVNEITHFPE